MEALNFPQHRLSREEMLTGMGASILVHLLVLAAAVIAPWAMPGKTSPTPFLSVNLVSMQEIGGGPSASRKGPPEKSVGGSKSESFQKSQTTPSARSAPVVPVKRLQLDDPMRKSETELKKLNPQEAPKIPEPTQSVASVEKSLEKLISKPKSQPRNSSAAQSAREETEPGQKESKSGGGAREGAAKAGAQGANPKGGAEGSPGGSIDGSGRVATALLGIYGDRVKEAINKQWAVPDVIKSQGLEARLVVVVSRDGRVLDLRVEKESGNALFDESAVRAVRKASPLPSLPEVITFPKVEIDIRFRPEGLS